MQEEWYYLKDVLEQAMHEELYSLKGLLQEERKYVETTKRFVSYEPDGGEIILSKKRTGLHKRQVMKVEKNLKWHPILFDGELYLIAHEPTRMQLCLRGKTGFWGSMDIHKEYSQLYGCEGLNAKGEPLTVEMFRSWPEHLWHIPGSYWLSSRRVEHTMTGEDYSMAIAINGYLEHTHLEKLGCRVYSVSLPLRPIVHLPANVLVQKEYISYNGFTPETAWRIKLAG